ncbi:MAG: twin-arginine translocase subunit TatB [Rhodomicrobium sp.]|nr:twin-arginine translocase subunit TatB [Rhodomicrobium sp.]
MFDIAWSEFLLIAIVALIFIGPKELPQVLQSLGRAVAKLRSSADEFRRQFEDSMRETGYEDLHKNIQDFRSLNPANQLKEGIERAINQEYAPPAQAPATYAEIASSEQLVNPDGQAAVPESRPAEPAAEQPPNGALSQESHIHPAVGAEKPVDEPSKDRAAPVA